MLITAKTFASVQTASFQVPPPALYVASYELGDGGSVASFFTNQVWSEPPYYLTHQTVSNNVVFGGSVHYDSTSGGSMQWSSTCHTIPCLYTNYGLFSQGEQNSQLAQSIASTILNSFGYPVGVLVEQNQNGIFNQQAGEGLPLVQESTVAMALYSYDFGAGGNKSHFSTIEFRQAQLKMKVKTGGKTTSKLRNVFLLGASAYAMMVPSNNFAVGVVGYDHINALSPASAANTIPNQNIAIAALGNLNSAGMLYKILPDASDIDVTPYVSGPNCYTFNVSTPIKYNSYIDVFCQQANPGFSISPYSQAYDVGHAFCRVRTEVPPSAMNFIPANQLQYLGTAVGFYPSNGIFSYPGQVEDDSGPHYIHSYNVKRTFYIGFPSVQPILQYWNSISNSPPVYNLSQFNCCDAVNATMNVAGFPDWMQYANIPQGFGAEMALTYPKPGEDPWNVDGFDDETNVYYLNQK